MFPCRQVVRITFERGTTQLPSRTLWKSWTAMLISGPKKNGKKWYLKATKPCYWHIFFGGEVPDGLRNHSGKWQATWTFWSWELVEVICLQTLWNFKMIQRPRKEYITVFICIKRFHCHMFCFQVLFNWRTANYKESTSKQMPSQTSVMHILSKHRYIIIRICLFLTNSLCNLPFTISTHPNVQICILPRWSNNKIHLIIHLHLHTWLHCDHPQGPRYIGQIIMPIAF